MSHPTDGKVHTVMQESRLFPPSEAFRSRARIGSMEAYQSLYERSIVDSEAFWGEEAREHLHWFEPFREVLRWNEPVAEWFVGGKTNASYNCLDRHLEAGLGDRVAIYWEGEPGDTRTLTYRDLHREVCQFANGLKAIGVQPGQVVSIYMPLVPE
ncbi:MAG: acetyl-coenzyme A synthetase N-terminal domain-containing protein, partial [Pirellulaceae bacterium]